MSSATGNQPTGLRRQLGLLGLAATGICSMLGSSICVLPLMIRRGVEAIGDRVLPDRRTI